jgi:hypothetical protein
MSTSATNFSLNGRNINFNEEYYENLNNKVKTGVKIKGQNKNIKGIGLSTDENFLIIKQKTGVFNKKTTLMLVDVTHLNRRQKNDLTDVLAKVSSKNFFNSSKLNAMKNILAQNTKNRLLKGKPIEIQYKKSEKTGVTTKLTSEVIEYSKQVKNNEIIDKQRQLAQRYITQLEKKPSPTKDDKRILSELKTFISGKTKTMANDALFECVFNLTKDPENASLIKNYLSSPEETDDFGRQLASQKEAFFLQAVRKGRGDIVDLYTGSFGYFNVCHNEINFGNYLEDIGGIQRTEANGALIDKAQRMIEIRKSFNEIERIICDPDSSTEQKNKAVEAPFARINELIDAIEDKNERLQALKDAENLCGNIGSLLDRCKQNFMGAKQGETENEKSQRETRHGNLSKVRSAVFNPNVNNLQEKSIKLGKELRNSERESFFAALSELENDGYLDGASQKE